MNEQSQPELFRDRLLSAIACCSANQLHSDYVTDWIAVAAERLFKQAIEEAIKAERQRIANCFRERADYQHELIKENAVHKEQAMMCADMFVHCARLLETGKEKLTEKPMHGYNHGK